VNEQKTKLRLRQTGHIRGYLWHWHSVMVNLVMVAAAKHSMWWLTTRNHWFSGFLFRSSNIKKIITGTTNSGISDQLG